MQKLLQWNNHVQLISVPNMIEMAATMGIDHLIPADVNLSFQDKYPMKLLVTGALIIFTAIMFVVGKSVHQRRLNEPSK
jgi:hypothetical protein